MEEYELGKRKRVYWTHRDPTKAGNPYVTPASVVFRYGVNGSLVTKTYPADPEIVLETIDGNATFHIDLDLTTSGRWKCRVLPGGSYADSVTLEWFVSNPGI